MNLLVQLLSTYAVVMPRRLQVMSRNLQVVLRHVNVMFCNIRVKIQGAISTRCDHGHYSQPFY